MLRPASTTAWGPCRERQRPSGAGCAADVDHIAVTRRGILIDEARDENATIEGNDLPILLASGRSGRTDVVFAARAALKSQFLWGGLIGQMHHYAARGAGADHVRLLALRPGRSLGARPVGGILVRCETPAPNNLVWPNGRGHLRRQAGLGGRGRRR